MVFQRKHNKTNGFSTFVSENTINQWFFNPFERKHYKTNGFSMFFSENTIKPMVFQRFSAKTLTLDTYTRHLHYTLYASGDFLNWFRRLPESNQKIEAMNRSKESDQGIESMNRSKEPKPSPERAKRAEGPRHDIESKQ